jgi:DNA-binding PadR family transcriptional regulator
MDIQSIKAFFRNTRYVQLTQEEAVCYLLTRLLDVDCYATQVINGLKRSSARYRLSDTNLYAAIKFLTEIGAISSYLQRCPGKGRPRKMFALVPSFRPEAVKLSEYWVKTYRGAI